MENVGSVAWETWKIAEETKTTMQELLARYSDFRRFCLQRRKETREIDSAAGKLETSRKPAVSINTEKNYMQVDDDGNEEPNSGDDDGGNEKNTASMSSTPSTSTLTRSNMDRCRLCSIKEDEDDKEGIELVKEMDRSLDLTIMEPGGQESLKHLDSTPCDPNTIVEKLKFLRGKGQIIRQTIRRLEIDSKTKRETIARGLFQITDIICSLGGFVGFR